ncbi:hypothetical protein [Polyangium aurulentum]|uniref:hypothetical protein n=1 Tax=Polyangium aurulentum TaxID=2567896 RepID=UPI0010AEAF7E|nr:hypothetical protein [Polyangium aurulentum]UQA59687.1 hypothetical protein E8A73_004060 [Polyangium aurulentum]
MSTEIVRRAIAAVVIASLAAPAARASAQEKARDPAAAEALYHRGRALVSEGNWSEGCAKFEASMELNPAASTLLNIAKCHEHDGKLAQATVAYRRALQLNQDTLGEERKKALEKVANEGIAALEPRLARVRVTLKERPAGARVARDGQELPLATLGEEIPLDPGEHTFEASAPGFRKDEKRMKLGEGEQISVELALVPAPPGADETRHPPALAGKDKDAKASSGGAPVWAFVVGGVGLAAVGAGIAFRFDQMATERRLVDECGEDLLCPGGIEYDWQSDNARKNRDFYLFVGLTAAGAVGIGAAVVGIVRGVGQKKKSQARGPIVAPWIGRGEGGAIVQGAF